MVERVFTYGPDEQYVFQNYNLNHDHMYTYARVQFKGPIQLIMNNQNTNEHNIDMKGWRFLLQYKKNQVKTARWGE